MVFQIQFSRSLDVVLVWFPELLDQHVTMSEDNGTFRLSSVLNFLLIQ